MISKHTFMKSILLLILCLIVSATFYGQISIDNTTYTATQLVDGVLIPTGSGTVITNVQYGGVLNNSNRYQLGYFGTIGTTQAEMGLSGGVVLSTGNTNSIPLGLGLDPGAVAQMSTGYTSCTAGEIREGGTCPTLDNDVNILVGTQNYYNASVLEFDFTPVSSTVSFRYIFGSEEYRDNNGFINYQCSSYNDKFGFLISGPGIAGGQGYTNDARNIARLANGSEVGINSVNQGEVGSSGGAPSASNCQNANPAWLENVSSTEFLGTIDGTGLNGNTVVLIAEQTGLTPGAVYHIRLIISDADDGAYDSVVYLEEGSFTTESPCTTPDAPSASTTTQPNCADPTGTITVTAPIGGVIEYSVDGITYQSSTVFSGLATGDYNITAQDNVTLCTSLITVVTVDPVPTPPAEPTTACYETATFNATSCVWDVTGTQPLEPTIACYETATFNTTLCVWDVTGTQDSPPTVSTVQPDCINITGTINISAPTGANIEYSIDGITFQSSPTFSGLIPGNYDVVAQDASIGCSSISAPISIDNIPSAEQVDAGLDVFILQNESATLTASGNGTFLWSTNENTNSISVSPLVDTEYCVTLTDINNCTSNDCVTIFLTPEDEDCEELFIPTAFSPNNDNNNDLYQIRINASCVQSMSMLIFDRWGELIIEMTDPNESWDGTYKGEPLNTASFAYVLRIKLSTNPEEQEFKGNITLVK